MCKYHIDRIPYYKTNVVPDIVKDHNHARVLRYYQMSAVGKTTDLRAIDLTDEESRAYILALIMFYRGQCVEYPIGLNDKLKRAKALCTNSLRCVSEKELTAWHRFVHAKLKEFGAKYGRDIVMCADAACADACNRTEPIDLTPYRCV
jgi:hypothetical protein